MGLPNGEAFFCWTTFLEACFRVDSLHTLSRYHAPAYRFGKSFQEGLLDRKGVAKMSDCFM